jgi:hypothetical protein
MGTVSGHCECSGYGTYTTPLWLHTALRPAGRQHCGTVADDTVARSRSDRSPAVVAAAAAAAARSAHVCHRIGQLLALAAAALWHGCLCSEWRRRIALHQRGALLWTKAKAYSALMGVHCRPVYAACVELTWCAQQVVPSVLSVALRRERCCIVGRSSV